MTLYDIVSAHLLFTFTLQCILFSFVTHTHTFTLFSVVTPLCCIALDARIVLLFYLLTLLLATIDVYATVLISFVSMSTSPAAMPTDLLSLPNELLFLVADKLDNIQDFVHLSSTCKSIQACLSSTQPRTILRLAAMRNSRTVIPPSLLIVGIAGMLQQWTCLSKKNEVDLRLNLQDGVTGILNLAQKHCGITLDRLCELRTLQKSHIAPAVAFIVHAGGSTQLAQAYNHCSVLDATNAVYELALYGELFGQDLDIFLSRSKPSSTKPLDSITRIEFIKYCIPDTTFLGAFQDYSRSESMPYDPLRHIKSTGPYKNAKNAKKLRKLFTHTVKLQAILGRRWFEARLRDVESRALAHDSSAAPFLGPQSVNMTSQAHMRQTMRSLMLAQGLDGLSMLSLTPNARDPCLDKIRVWAHDLVASHKASKSTISKYPNVPRELFFCMYYIGRQNVNPHTVLDVETGMNIMIHDNSFLEET